MPRRKSVNPYDLNAISEADHPNRRPRSRNPRDENPYSLTKERNLPGVPVEDRMVQTEVVNIRHGESYDVLIDRRTKWGNPFRIGRDGTRVECVAKYQKWIMTQPELLASLDELKGKRLGCWCVPLLCHGQVLVELIEHSSK